jgi:hypothetical protein
VVAPVLKRGETSSRAKAAQYAREIEQQFETIRTEWIKSFISKIEN